MLLQPFAWRSQIAVRSGPSGRGKSRKAAALPGVVASWQPSLDWLCYPVGLPEIRVGRAGMPAEPRTLHEHP